MARRGPNPAVVRAKKKAEEARAYASRKVAKMKDDIEGIKARGTGAAIGLAAAHFYGDYVGKKELEGKPLPLVPVLNVPVARAAGLVALGIGVAGLADDEATNTQLAMTGAALAGADMALAARMKRLAAGLPSGGVGP